MWMLRVRRNAHVDVAGASAHVDVAGAKVVIAEWQAIVDPTTGSTYYYNTETGESSWARPVH